MMNTLNAHIYLVGGAVRDELLGRPVRDRDWVVVGASETQMLEAGFVQVGKDFPVFLHPETKEEYALARQERKTAAGYRGFEVSAGPSVSLEDDLARRDLTINAIAKAANGQLVDPFGGVADLKARRLRHVSAAFAEDPVRILRVARFMARYSGEGFSVAEETLQLMRQMVQNGEVDALTPERVWAEMHKAFTEPHPEAFVQVLRQCGALERVLPEVDALYGIPQPLAHHPEGDTGVHTELVIAQARRLSSDPQVIFAALTHDLGKALTPPELLPSHPGHEKGGLEPLHALCARLKVPAEYAAIAQAVCKSHLTVHRIREVRPGTVLDLFKSLDAFRRPSRIEALALACEADARGRTGLEERDYPQAQHLRDLFKAASQAKLTQADTQNRTGEQIAQRLQVLRLNAIHALHGGVRKAELKEQAAARPRKMM